MYIAAKLFLSAADQINIEEIQPSILVCRKIILLSLLSLFSFHKIVFKNKIFFNSQGKCKGLMKYMSFTLVHLLRTSVSTIPNSLFKYISIPIPI